MSPRELSARRSLNFEDYTEAVRNLAAYDELPADLVQQLATLPGFRNVLIHEYVELDLARAVESLGRNRSVPVMAVPSMTCRSSSGSRKLGYPVTVTTISLLRGRTSHSRWKTCCQVPSTGRLSVTGTVRDGPSIVACRCE